MDVRCEKCLTEYELDEARLKPTGVTVKCTNCGHMFKIRKRSSTNVGTAVAVPPTASKPNVGGDGPTKVARVATDPSVPAGEAAAGDSGPHEGGERLWMIRLENGETKTCRDLATLQQWIVGSVVTRDSLISRTGKTWKRLGDVAELGSYFTIADESRQRRGNTPGPAAPAAPAPAPPGKGTMIGVGANAHVRPRTPTPPPPPPAAQAHHATPPPPPAPRRSPTQPPPPPQPKRAPTAPPPPPAPRPPAAAAPSVPPPAPGLQATGAWASADVKLPLKDDGPQGPSGGKLGGVPTEPTFGGRLRPMSGDFGTGGEEVFDPDQTGPMAAARGSRAGTWIAAVAVLAIAGAAAATYFLVFRKKNDAVTKPAVLLADAGTGSGSGSGSAVAVGGADAAPAPISAVDEARVAMFSETPARLVAAATALRAAGDSAEVWALQARVLTTLAQALTDQAALTAEPAAAEALRKQAQQRVLDAVGPAQRALKAAPTSAAANLAMADVLRLQSKPSKDVQRYLTAAASAAPGERDGALVAALLTLRDGRRADAAAALGKLDAEPGQPGSCEQTEDARPRFQLALLDLAAGRREQAAARAQSLLAALPDHAGARALSDKVAGLVSATDPMPPEEPGAGSGAGSGSATSAGTGGGSGTTGGGGGGGGGAVVGDNYDQLIEKANRYAEESCGKAMPYYDRALDLKPNSVDALVGTAFCHIDAKQFASAQSKFRAALTISPRNERALWGVAEAYQQQGRKENAIEAYKAYLEYYPGSGPAKKQLQLLGADVGAGGGSGGGGAGGAGSAEPAPSGGGPAGGDSTPPAGDGSGSGT